jgi:hypothetical protein
MTYNLLSKIKPTNKDGPRLKQIIKSHDQISKLCDAYQ